MADEWMDVPAPAAAPPVGGDWQDVPAPEPVQGTQGISDRLSKGFQPAGLQSYVLRKLPDIAADTATFFHEGVEQTIGAFTGNGPSQFDDIRPEVEKQLISIGRTPEIAKLETEQLMRSWRRQERMGGAVMGPLTALTAPLLGAYRSLISRPLEEAGGPPKEVTEMAGMVAGAVYGLPEMSRAMARVKVTPDGKVSAQAVGDLPKDADFKTAAELVAPPLGPEKYVLRDPLGAMTDGQTMDVQILRDKDGKPEGLVTDHGVTKVAPAYRDMPPEQIIAETFGDHLQGTAADASKVTRKAVEVADPAIVEQNLRTLWDERGIHPAEALHDAQSDAFLKHELTQPPIEAFHGSPHEFTAFDIYKIDTGEGAQVFGHGLYFAEHPDVAKSYATKLSEGEGNIYRVKVHANTDHMIDFFKNLDEQSPFVLQAFERLRDTIKAENPLAQSGLMLDSLLGDKNKALQKVLDATKAMGAEAPEKKSLSFEDFYRQFAKYDFDQISAAEMMRDAGIPGIKYLDDLSRMVSSKIERRGDKFTPENKTGGFMGEHPLFDTEQEAQHYIDTKLPPRTRNFVVFKDEDVQITHINDKPFYDQRFKQAVDARDARIIQGLEEAPPIQEPVTPHPDRPLGEALRAADELRAANRNLPTQDRAVLGELISAVRSAAAKRQLSVEDGVVQQGDRFGKAPLSETAPAADAIAEHAWVEADQDLARAQAALARIDEVKARHPELAGTIDKAVQAVEDTLAQRDAMRPKSLGAAATDPPLTPLSVQPRSPAGSLVASAQENVRFLFDIGKDIQMKVAPMATGTRDPILAAKDFANTMRKNRWDWARVDDFFRKTFNDEQDRRMFNAMDEESVALQKGESREHQGLATLEPQERAAVEAIDDSQQRGWLRMMDLGMVKSEGIPMHATRALIGLARAKGEMALSLDMMGQNLTTRTPFMRHRKYLTVEETEAAAKAKYGEEVSVARSMRSVILSIAKMEDAIAGRELVNKIQEYGKAAGDETVSEGTIPAGSEHKWFTIDHPALKTWRPRFEEVDGKARVVKDADGGTVFDQVPIYIRDDFEGPLRAVLEKKSGATYQALMALKGKTTSVIMYTPAIHNLVELGRAFPAMPTRIIKAYFDGYRAKNDPAIMHEAIDSGLVPIGKRFFNQDLDGLLESPDLTAGRSWTAKIASAVLTAEKILPQTDWMRAASEKDALAIKKGIDKLGDFWHNTLLWDRIGDLQTGLYTNLRGDLMAKGVDQATASIVAAHWANRYAGAIPQEAMSSGARKVSNFFFFSRSFTMGNLGVMKDMLTGMPKDTLAMVERAGGFKEGSIGSASDIPQVGEFSKGLAARKAMMIVALDIGLLYVGNSILQSILNVMLGDKTIDEEAHGYTRRFKETLNNINMHPSELFHPFRIAESLTPMADNEPGKKDRVMIGRQSDGTAIYLRNPVGKIGEEFMGWMDTPLEMLRKKEGTIARPALQIFANDKGFGRKVYDPNTETYMDKAAAIWAMVEHFGKAQTPEGSINAVSDLVRGEGDPKTNALQAGLPFVGMTVSKGAPGGPAAGEMYDYRQRHDVKVNMALPDIRKQILRGDLGGAMQRMRELDIPPGLQRFYVRTTLDPSTRVGGRTLRDFYLGATDAQRERLERARQ